MALDLGEMFGRVRLDTGALERGTKDAGRAMGRFAAEANAANASAERGFNKVGDKAERAGKQIVEARRRASQSAEKAAATAAAAALAEAAYAKAIDEAKDQTNQDSRATAKLAALRLSTINATMAAAAAEEAAAKAADDLADQERDAARASIEASTVLRAMGNVALATGAKMGAASAAVGLFTAKFSLMGVGVAAALPLLGAATMQVLSLAGTMVTASGAALALPGIMLGAGAGLAAVALAAKDAGTQLQALKEPYAALQKNVSAAFWQQAAQPIRDMAMNLLPTLSAGLSSVATAAGGFAAELGRALSGGAMKSMLTEVFTQQAVAINVAKAAIGPMVSALAALGSVGAQYIVPLTRYFTDLSIRFSMFITQAAADGSLKRWVDTGIAALGQLMSIVKSVIGIVFGLLRSFQYTGGELPIVTVLNQLNTWINSPVGQGAIQALMAGIGQSMQNLAPLFTMLGTVAGALVPMLGQMIPAVTAALGPAFNSLGTIILSLLPLIGSLLPVAAQLISAILAALAPIVTGLVSALTPLVPIIGQALLTALNALSPILNMLATLVFPLLGQVIAALLPPLMQIVMAVASLLIPILQAIMPVVTTIISALIPIVQGALTIIQGIIQVFTGLITGNWSLAWEGIKNIFIGVWNVLQSTVMMIGNLIVMQLQLLGQSFIAIFQFFCGMISAAWQGFWNFLIFTARLIAAAIHLAITLFLTGLQMAWQAFVNFISTTWQIFWNGLHAFASMTSAIIRATLDAWWAGLRGAWSSFTDFVSGLWRRFWDGLKSTGDFIMGLMRSAIDNTLNGIKGAFESAVRAIGDIWNGIKKAVGEPINVAIKIANVLIDGFNTVAGLVGIPEDKRPKHIGEANWNGWRSGGYTGKGNPSKVAGLVHNDEQVIRSASRRNLEREKPGALDYMNRTGEWPTGKTGEYRNMDQNRPRNKGRSVPSTLPGVPVNISSLAGRGPAQGDKGEGGPVEWGLGQIGSMGWYRRCLAFVNAAWGHTVARLGMGTARASMDAGPRRMDGVPPAGAAVYWDTGGWAGHVTLAVGDGTELSNDILVPGRIDRVPMNTFASKWGARYMGWYHPLGLNPGQPLDPSMVANIGGGGIPLFDPIGMLAEKFKGALDPLKKLGDSPWVEWLRKLSQQILDAMTAKIKDAWSKMMPTMSGGVATGDMNANARLLMQAGKAQGVPRDAMLLALMCAAQESSMGTDPSSMRVNSDGDVGWFQNRTTRGDGTVAQLNDPGYGLGVFLHGVNVPGGYHVPGLYDKNWRGMDPGAAIQSVQVSAHPTLYSKWRGAAEGWLNSFGYALGTNQAARGFRWTGEKAAELVLNPQMRKYSGGETVLNGKDTGIALGGKGGATYYFQPQVRDGQADLDRQFENFMWEVEHAR